MPSGLGGRRTFVYSMTARLQPPATEHSTTDRSDTTEEERPRSTPRSGHATSASSDDGTPDVAADELLELLGDEYACEILRALGDGPLPARDIIDDHDMSRPTVYRRLDRLTEAGIVEARLRPARDGHHRQEFRLAVDEVEFEVGTNGITGRVHVTEQASD